MAARVRILLAANDTDAATYKATHPTVAGRPAITPRTLDRLKGLRVDPIVTSTPALRADRAALLKVCDAVRPHVVRR